MLANVKTFIVKFIIWVGEGGRGRDFVITDGAGGGRGEGEGGDRSNAMYLEHFVNILVLELDLHQDLFD